MGKTASSGGVYSTMRIPFQRRFRSTIQADPSVKGQSVYWMIVRGIEAYPVVVGDLTLPDTARLTVCVLRGAGVRAATVFVSSSSSSSFRSLLISIRFTKTCCVRATPAAARVVRYYCYNAQRRR